MCNLNFPQIGGYGVKDIQIVAAFDFNKEKVNQLLDKAVFVSPNVTKEYMSKEKLNKFSKVKVNKRPLLDEIGSERAIYKYAVAVIAAHCSFINGTPIQLATVPE